MAKPRITLVAAVAANGVIGCDNDLPWRLPEDLQFFKQMTLGKPILMGRKNYESIGRPLPGRQNVVLTRDVEYRAEGCEIAHSVGEVYDLVDGVPELMIIGGAEIYGMFLDVANRMILTEIDQSVAGDVYFPEWFADDWRLMQRSGTQISAKSDLTYRYTVLDRT